jgi:ribosomal protein S18 acetylase RimI-like enzyme
VARPDIEFNRHYRARRGYLGPAATLVDHRGRGLAKALTVRALIFLKSKGYESASLYTWSGNTAAVAAVRGLGFRTAHEWKILRKRLRDCRNYERQS